MTPVTSHELARMLLARRDTDLMVRVDVDDDAQETGNPALHDTHWVAVLGIEYDADLDRMIIFTEEASGPSWSDG